MSVDNVSEVSGPVAITSGNIAESDGTRATSSRTSGNQRMTVDRVG